MTLSLQSVGKLVVSIALRGHVYQNELVLGLRNKLSSIRKQVSLVQDFILRERYWSAMPQFLGVTKPLRNGRPFFLNSPARCLGFAAATVISGPSSLSGKIRSPHRLRLQQHREAAFLRRRITVPTFPRVDESVRHLVQILGLELMRLHEEFHVISFCLLELFSLLVAVCFGFLANLAQDLLPSREASPEMP